MKEQIIACKTENPLWGYKKIAAHLGCTQGLVRYHLKGDVAKLKTRERMAKLRKRDPIYIKRARFCQDQRVPVESIPMQDILNKFGPNPTCYLTGRTIDLEKPETYSFDHIVPIARGGQSTLENLGLTCREANDAKRTMTPEEFISLCREVIALSGAAPDFTG